MIKEIEVDIRCDLFYLLNTNLYTWNRSDKKLFRYSSDFKSVLEEIGLSDSISVIYSSEQNNYIIDGRGKVYTTDLLLRSFSVVDPGITAYQFEKSYSDHKIIITSRNYEFDPPRMLQFYDLNEARIEWEINTNTRYVYLDEDFLVVDDIQGNEWKKIKRLSVINGSTIWSQDLGSSIKKFLGVSGKVIIVQCDNYTVGIDKDTGEMLWNYSLVQTYESKTDKCYFIGGDEYISFDPQTGEESEKYKINSELFYPTRQSPILYKNWLVTTNIDNNKVGFFDINNKVFTEVLNIDEGIVLADKKFLRASKDFLFLLTSKNVLKIYIDVNHEA